MSKKLFGTDGVRGIANTEPITAESALRLAQAAGRVLSKEEPSPTVVVGRDTRASGEMLESAIAAGLASHGIHVFLAGIVPTPAVAYLTARHNASFGIVISASHNPFQDNGIKFFDATGYKLGDEFELAIETEFFHPGSYPLPTGRSIGRIRQVKEATEEYVAFAASTVPKDFSLTGVKVAARHGERGGLRNDPHGTGHARSPGGFCTPAFLTGSISISIAVAPTQLLSLAMFGNLAPRLALPTMGMPTAFYFVTNTESRWMAMNFWPSLPSICWPEIGCKRTLWSPPS